MNDLIYKKDIIAILDEWLKVDGYNWGELNIMRALRSLIEDMGPINELAKKSAIIKTNDLISRQNVLKALCCVCKIHDSDPCPVEGICRFYKALEAMPSSEKTGKWIKEPNCMFRCSVCGEHYPSTIGYMRYRFCPTCGAKMEVEHEQ